MADYDVIVIGAGLNGLVAANYLAKAGRKVLVLERREIAGGQAATEPFTDGEQVDSLHPGGGVMGAAGKLAAQEALKDWK